MPQYWVNNYFTHGRFPEVGQKQKPASKKVVKELQDLRIEEENGQIDLIVEEIQVKRRVV